MEVTNQNIRIRNRVRKDTYWNLSPKLAYVEVMLFNAGEMLVGLARCFFMDDISTGLDSSTTFEIMKFLQQMAHLMDLTMVISLLQPPPETLELFDDIILLCEGQIVYHGPRENATDFFETMGFKCPDRKNVADFLQEVSNHQMSLTA